LLALALVLSWSHYTAMSLIHLQYRYTNIVMTALLHAKSTSLNRLISSP